MRLVCAWCEHEGRPADMGVREPREDPTATHGLCPAHSAALVHEGPDGLRHLRTLQAPVRQLDEQAPRLQTPEEAP
jgi:hypothetical protein